MFSQIVLFFLSTLAMFVVARPGLGPSSSITDSCNVSKQYCCNDIQDSKSEVAQKQAKEFGLLDVLAPITGQVGLTCTSAGILAITGQSCTSQAACCEGDNFSGAVVVGCSPTNLNL